jgi:hypothetical protein
MGGVLIDLRLPEFVLEFISFRLAKKGQGYILNL